MSQGLKSSPQVDGFALRFPRNGGSRYNERGASARAKTWLGVIRVLKIGYGLMMLAGACLVGYASYHVVRALVASPAIPTFFKGLILLAALGVIVTLIGLVRERRKEEKDDPIDNGSD